MGKESKWSVWMKYTSLITAMALLLGMTWKIKINGDTIQANQKRFDVIHQQMLINGEIIKDNQKLIKGNQASIEKMVLETKTPILL